MAKFLTIRHSFCELMTKKDAISSNHDYSISEEAGCLSENSNIIVVSYNNNKYKIITPSEFIRQLPVPNDISSITTIIDCLDEVSEEERKKYLTNVLINSKSIYSVETICEFLSIIIINRSGVNCSCKKCNHVKDILEICYNLPKEDLDTSIKKFMDIHTTSSDISDLCTIISKNKGGYNHKTNYDKNDKDYERINDIVDEFIKFLSRE